MSDERIEFEQSDDPESSSTSSHVQLPASATTAQLVNPYAIKRASPSLYSGPLHSLPVNEPALPGLPISKPDEDRMETGDDEQQSSKAPATDSAQSPLDNPRIAVSKPQAGISAEDLPQWQRLPSRHLSFGSAEILTIPECAQYLRSDQAAKSVSVTGTIRYMVPHNQHMQAVSPCSVSSNDDDSTRIVSLVLGDPLAPLNPIRTLLNRPSAGPPRVSMTPARPLASRVRQLTNNPQYATQKTPLPPSQLPRTSHASSASHPTLQRPGLPKKRSFKSISRKSRSSLVLGGSNRRTSIMDPLERLTAELHKDASTVWVQADPTVVPVHSYQIGQLLTVMGEIIVARNSSDAEESAGELGASAPATKHDMDVSTMTNDAGDEHGAAMSGLAHAATTRDLPTMAWIRARILRNATGTNMKLYTDALMARRKMIEQIR